MVRFEINDHADQKFATILNTRRVTLRLRYNTLNDRWSFDLSIDDLPVLHSRRIVLGVDLLAPFSLGIGLIFAAPIVPNSQPDRVSLPNGSVRLYHATPADVELVENETVD